MLLVRQGKKRRGWELPGGKVKKRESLPDAAIREVKEEAGIDVIPEQLLAVFFIPAHNTYDFIVRCRAVEDNAAPVPNPPETIDVQYFRIDELPKPISTFTIDRISDAVERIVHPLPIELKPSQWLR